MYLLDVVNINDEERVFKCNHTDTFYKMENNNLMFKNKCINDWSISNLTVRELRVYTVEEIQEGSKRELGKIYYFIDNEGDIISEKELFTFVDDIRYEFGNYFECEEDARECRDLINETIKTIMNGR